MRRAKQGASYQVKDLLFQNLASRDYRVLQLCLLTHRASRRDRVTNNIPEADFGAEGGETARLKRTQGITQATGRLANA